MTGPAGHWCRVDSILGASVTGAWTADGTEYAEVTATDLANALTR